MNRELVWTLLGLLFLALVPVVSAHNGEAYYTSLVCRMMIFAIAAVGLNLILGFGGSVSFGHALYLGLGAYVMGILSFHGITDGWVQLLVMLLVCGLVALVIGAVVVRVNGMTFIMITLAFAQMGYFLTISLKQYGGDDGLTIASRSQFFGDALANNTVLYYAVLGSLVALLLVLSRLLNARFGLTLRGLKSNERRLKALGHNTFAVKLTAYVISALICGLAGFWLANLTQFAAPSYLAWTVSGELIVMAILGGMTVLFGPVVGACLLLSLEAWLSDPKWPDEAMNTFFANHWMGVIGLCIFVLAMTTRTGVLGTLVKAREGVAH